jgi:hypothetical protein
VVSALSSRHGFGDGRRTSIDDYDLTLWRKLGARLRQLDADIRWLTTWDQQANSVGARMGLQPLPVAGSPPQGATSSGPWKLEIVKAVVECERRAFVWIDDDAIGRDAEVWLENCPVRGVFIRPKANRGLTPPDLEAVEAFIADVAAD